MSCQIGIKRNRLSYSIVRVTICSSICDLQSESAQGAAAAGAMGGRGGFASRGRGRGMRRR